MNIKQYYKDKARSEFVVAAVACSGIISLVVIELNRKWEIFVPLLVFSVFFFSAAYLNYKRSEEVSYIPCEKGKTLTNMKDILLLTMPSPDIHMLFFDTDGTAVAQLKSKRDYALAWLYPRGVTTFLPSEWILYDFIGNELAAYKKGFGLNPPLRIYNKEGELIGAFHEHIYKSLIRVKGSIVDANGKEIAPVDVDGYLYGYDIDGCDGRKWMEFQKGWMPLEWGTRFREMNTPVVTLGDSLKEEERYMTLGLAAYFVHRNQEK